MSTTEVISAEAHRLAPHLNWHSRRLVAEFNTGLTKEQRTLYGTRLLRLAEYLKNIPAKKYNHEVLISRIEKNTQCGTVACALGHAVASGQFEGLNVEMVVHFADESRVIGSEFDNLDSNIDFEIINEGDICNFFENSIEEIGENPTLVHAADAFFGPGAWFCIFDGDSYFKEDYLVKKSTVINRIKNIANKCYGLKELPVSA